MFAIVATDRNGAIGKDGKLPWHIPEDLRFFKRSTTGKIVIMGRKTYESLPFRLADRFMVVITSQKRTQENGVIYCTPEQAIAWFADYDNVVVAGGAEIYKRFLPLCNRLLRTVVDTEVVDADAHFEFDESEWKVGSSMNLGDNARVFEYRLSFDRLWETRFPETEVPKQRPVNGTR